MTKFESRRLQDGATDRRTELQPRDARALTEKMVVLPEGGDLFTVVGQNAGGEYTVDVREGRCTCADAQYNLDEDEACKHELRVRYAIGDRPIPAWADTDAVDPQLGTHVNGGPERVAADGGTEIVVAGDEGELLEDGHTETALDEHPGSDRYALGIDVDGHVHYHKTGGDVVRVVDPNAGEQVHIEHLGERSVEAWVEFVEGRDAWNERYYGVGLAGALADVLGGGRHD
jgi:hypothetical protein